MKRKNVVWLIVLVVLIGIGYYLYTTIIRSDTDTPQILLNESVVISTVAENLHVPWNIAFLPTGEMLVTERNGTLRVMATSSKTIAVPDVVERGEGGLLGLALHPNFPSNKFVYLYFTSENSGTIINRVVRYTFDGSDLKQNKIILDTIPGGSNHNGGRIAFGPDGRLYITTGDAGNDTHAQDRNSLAGKILRIHDDGSIPSDNPFGSAVYSYGHRNPQGLAWDSEGNLWETEHGRSGVQSGYDEINFIVAGGNYGWPIIQGDEIREGMIKPVLHSGSSTTWAPSGIAFANGKLYFAGLRGQALYEVSIVDTGKLGTLNAYVQQTYGRLRAVTITNDGLYFSTSNQDGRGDVNAGDDKILKITGLTNN
jgi:glucose/arabinose dehydrogenase